jgi:hypothetical protein
MRRFLRSLAILMLALAVPLQGLAGVTMAACGGAHAHVADHHAGMHGQEAAHPGGMHHYHAAGHDGAAPEGHQAHDCAACAACCNLSAAPIPAVAVSGPDSPSAGLIPFFGSAHASVQARGLERPPSPSIPG